MIAVDPHHPLGLALLECRDVVVAIHLLTSISTDSHRLAQTANTKRITGVRSERQDRIVVDAFVCTYSIAGSSESRVRTISTFFELIHL